MHSDQREITPECWIKSRRNGLEDVSEIGEWVGDQDGGGQWGCSGVVALISPITQVQML